MNRLVLELLARRASRNRSEEAGQGLAEYALILALVATACIGALSALGIGIGASAGFVTLPQSF
jgi:Flp pilus assembly pilin Flp